MDANTLSSILPITISEHDVSQFPMFARLLGTLTDQIAPNGMDQVYAEEYKRFTHVLETEKQQYFQNKVVLDTTKELLMDRYSRPVADNVDDRQQKHLSNILLHSINVAETEQLLNISDSVEEEINVLGVTPEWLHEANKPSEEGSTLTLEQHIQYNIFPELEERLQQKYDAIQQFYHPMSNNSMLVDEYDADASQSQFLNATGSLHHKYGLPNQIDRQKKRAQQEKEQLRKEEEKYAIDYWVYFRKLLECLELLVTLLEEYRLKAFKDFDEVALQWLQERTKTARLKLNVIRYEYLTHTYHTDAIESLKHMRQTLEQEYEQCKRQSGRVERELEQYASVGLGFDKLVDEYTQITAKIKTKKWEIQQLDS